MSNKSRLTLDMSAEEHMYLKMACAKLGITMKSFLLQSAFEKMQDIEDEWISKKAKDVLEEIRSGKDKTILWSEFKKNIG